MADDKPLVNAQIPLKIHIVKDHDMREHLCLEAERLGLSAMIMGSRGFGATKRGNDGRLGSVSDYCVRHCACPVVVVRYPDEKARVECYENSKVAIYIGQVFVLSLIALFGAAITTMVLDTDELNAYLNKYRLELDPQLDALVGRILQEPS